LLIAKTPLKYLSQGDMIELHSLVAFFDKAKWTELAIAHEINRVLGENTINYSTVGKYARTFVLSMKETDTNIVPGSEGYFSHDNRMALVLSEGPFLSVRQIAKKVVILESTLCRHLTQTTR
jgi:hypothetical protein